VAMMFVSQPAKLFVGFHQVRLQFFLRALHQGSISFVRLPRRGCRIDLTRWVVNESAFVVAVVTDGLRLCDSIMKESS
ncbi:MAG TPA: hypothetical protein VFW44_17560, partial [Bryobacteraceae bacterium]|nr:hypothetical protein [Bryobacteraceae bacterium]